MSYQKLLVDNTACSRRFHITFDDEAKAVAKTEVRCQFCNIVIFAATNHPPANLAREENLTKTSALAETLVTACAFEDRMSQRTIPEFKDKDAHVYPQSLTPKAPGA